MTPNIYAETQTYLVFVGEMPKPWENRFGDIWTQAKDFWTERIPDIEFIDVKRVDQAHFTVQWASQYDEGTLGYFGKNKFGQFSMSVTLGYFDKEGKWTLVSPEYAREITKHELGHVLGFPHSDDPDDIMYPSLENYEEWQKLQEEKETKIPDWIRENAEWWSQGLIQDDDFVSGLQYLIDENILSVPATTKTNGSTLPFVPNWIKDTAGWWASGKVTDSDFINGLKWLIENGIIHV